MRRRHNAVAIAVGALLTTIALAIGLAIESPGLPGRELLDGATSVLRLSDPEPATTVVTLPAKLAAKHHVSARAAVKVRAHRRHGHAQVHTAVPAARRHRTSVGRTGAAQGQARKSTPTTPAPAATPAPAPTPARAATPAPAATAPKASPSPVAAKTAKADLKVASASVSRNGNVRVVLAVSQPANGTPTTATLPGQLNVNLNMAALRHASDAGPIALDTALDLVPDPSNASGVGLRMRMQLAPGDSATPTAPAEDPNGLSNVVTLRLAMPDTTPAPKPTPTPTPADPGDPTATPTPTPADPAPVAAPVEVQLPIAPADAPADPSSQTVQLPVPPAATDTGGDAPATPAVPVDVSVTPVAADPAPAADPVATPSAG